MRWTLRRTLLCAAGAVWSAAIIGGMLALYVHGATPSAKADAPAHWPAESRLHPASSSATLVMLVHPQCPCTKASLEELSQVMNDCGDRLIAYVVFEPLGTQDVTITDLWQTASAIPGLRPVADKGDAESRNFRAATSGQVLVYDAAGVLIYNGGLTASRGHAGDNEGEDALVSMLQSKSSGTAQFPVYGCALKD